MAMALSLGSASGGRRRRSCRAARRGSGGAGCRRFHVHYHIPRQVWALSPPWLPPRFLLLPYLLILPVLFLAVLAFLVCFGWLTLVYLASSLWSRSVDRAGGASGFAGEDEREERPVKPVTEHAAGRSGLSEVCVGEGKTKIGEVGDGISEERRYISTMASAGICVSDEERASDEKIVKEVMVSEPCKAFAELDGSIEKHQLLVDIPIDCFLEEVNTKEFSISLSNTTELLHVLSVGEVIAADTKEVSVLSSAEIWKFVGKHDTAEEILVDGPGAGFVIPEVTSSADSTPHGHGLEEEYTSETKQEQSLAELSADTVPEKLPGDVTDEWQETQPLVTEHNNKQPEPEAASSEEYGEQIVGVSDESHDYVRGMSGSLLDSVRENISENATASNTPFHQTNSDEDTELQEDLIPNKRAESSAPASAVCDFADNHWRTVGELAGSADEGNVHEEGTSVLETVDDEDEDIDNHVSMGAPRRLPLVRRSPAPWWSFCGVLDAFAGGED